MRLLSLLVVCASTTVAIADPAPRFEVLDRGSAVEIIARDIQATATTLRPVRERLEVPIAATDSIPKLSATGDKLVKLVELDGHSRPVLSVKLAFERPEVRELAKVAQAIQVGKDLHVIVPRALPAAGQTVVLPEPTLPPELIAQAAAIAPVPTIERPAVTATQAAPAPAPVAEPPPAAQPASPPANAQPGRTTAARAPEPHNNTAILLVLALAALGSDLWLKRKNRKPAEAASSIEIVAQKALGAKAKIVWVRAGEREMIVAVSPQSVRTLGQWKRDAREMHGRAPLPEAVTHSAAADTASSPAVAGILKLRARTSTNTDEMLAGDGDADSAWAKEILAATTGMRR